ncbi:MAG: glycosyltransferase family 4 protein [Gammaproteobacteria bacterium]|nr:glycosyltransferase family 4 protein [Gammaproteobacteria bacterium]
MERLKVLWLSHVIPYPPIGGVLQRSYNLIKEVSKYHDVYLLAFNQKDLMAPLFVTEKDGIQEAKEELGKLCKEVTFFPIPSEDMDNGKVILAAKSLFSSVGYTINWLKSPDMVTSIRAAVSCINFDVVHYDTISLTPYLKYTEGIRTVLDHHNIESSMLYTRITKEPNFLKKVYFLQEAVKLRRYEKKWCNKFSLNITCSDIDSQRLLEIVPEVSVQTVPNGVDIDFFYSQGAKKEANSLVFAGGLSWYPNADAMSYFARHIWQKLKVEIPSVVMNVIGKHPSAELLALSEADLDFRVLGFVDDVRTHIDKAQVYVCPIRDGGGTKLKILDALSMGAAIVAHPKAVEGINVEDEESVLIADTPEQFCTQIKRLTTSEALRHKLSTNGRNLVIREYSYGKIGKEFAAELNGLVKEGG